MEPQDPSAVADGAGDLFDGAGASTVAETYLDIARTRLWFSEGRYTARIELTGLLPSGVGTGNSVEWDLLVDSDRKASTGNNWPLIANDLGIDYLIRVCADNRQISQGALDVKADGWSNINYRYRGNVVELYFPPESIGNAQAFDYAFAVRKYVSDASGMQLAVLDKAPNSGHRTLPEDASGEPADRLASADSSGELFDHTG